MHVMMSRRGEARGWLLAMLLMVIALLAPASARAFSAQQQEAVAQVERFFNSFRTLRGEFTQISPRGRVSTGRFYIARPGRMRFEYAPPHPLVIVSDGTWVAIRNNARDKVDYYPLSKTPLRMVLAERVNLARDAIIQSVRQQDGLLLITLKDRDKLVPGSLLLVFDPRHGALRQWTVIDGHGRRTTITLSQLERDVEMAPRLFKVKRPGEGPRRAPKKQNFGARRQ